MFAFYTYWFGIFVYEEIQLFNKHKLAGRLKLGYSIPLNSLSVSETHSLCVKPFLGTYIETRFSNDMCLNLPHC